MSSGALKITVCICVIMACAHVAFGQEEDDSVTELVIEDFETTGLGDSTGFAFAIEGSLEGTAGFDVAVDFFVSPLFAVRFALNALAPLGSDSETEDTIFGAGFGTVWRSYVVNRIRFYGGLVLRAGIAPFTDRNILFIPEAFGGFEFFVSSKTSAYAEFGGRSAIPLASLEGDDLVEEVDHAEGFFFRIGARFGF